ncbi:MAG: PepSY domain-containing protein [Pseudomonadota bacterium]
MRKTLSVAAVALIAGIGGPAFAEDRRDCEGEAGPSQVSEEALVKKIDDLGYDVRRFEADDGCFEAHVVDRESGGAVKAIYSRIDGELLRAKPASD